MSTPFSMSGVFTYPPDDGQPVATRDFSQSGQFNSKSEEDLVLVGAGTISVGFGTVAMAKAVLIEVAATASAPIEVKLNGGTDVLEISPGGFWAYSSPAPSVGITALDIDYTADAKVKVRILG
jgi:hypothetical protein